MAFAAHTLIHSYGDVTFLIFYWTLPGCLTSRMDMEITATDPLDIMAYSGFEARSPSN